MLLRLRLEPNPSHALYFPGRKNASVFVGEAVRIPRWSTEEFKHADLSDFELSIVFGQDGKSIPARTQDNLPCRVTAVFILRPLSDPSSLAKATFGFPASRSLTKVCSAAHFRNLLTGDLRALVQAAVGSITFAGLLADQSTAKAVEQSLRGSCAAVIQKHGFELIDCGIPIEVLEPEPSAFTAELRATWEDYQKRKAWATESKLRLEADQKIAEIKLRQEVEKAELALRAETRRIEDEAYLEEERAKHKREQEIEGMLTKQKESSLAEEKARAVTQAQLAELSDAAQRRDIEYEEARKRYEAELSRKREEEDRKAAYEADGLKQEREADLADQKRRSETQRQQGQLQDRRVLTDLEHEQLMLAAERKSALAERQREEESRERAHRLAEAEHTKQMAEIEASRAEQEKKSLAVKKAVTEELGLAEARVMKEKALAVEAAAIAKQDKLLSALPDILAKSYAAGEKVGEVKYMYLGGAVGTTSESGARSSMNQVLDSVMASISTLPLLKDVLNFLRTWDAPHPEAQQRTPQHAIKSANTEGDARPTTMTEPVDPNPQAMTTAAAAAGGKG